MLSLEEFADMLLKKVWPVLVILGTLGGGAAVLGWRGAHYETQFASAARVDSVAADLGALRASYEAHEAAHAEQMRRVDGKLDELTEGVKSSNAMIFRVLQEQARGRRRE